MQGICLCFTARICARKKTAEEVKEHLESCEECRKYYNDNFKNLNKKETKTNNDKNIKPFKKINKKLKKSKFKVIILSVILMIIIIPIGVLTLGEIFHSSDVPSFQKIYYNCKARKMAEYFINGDMKKFCEYINFNDNEDISDIRNGYTAQDYFANKLQSAYEKELKGHKGKIVDIYSIYDFHIDDFDGVSTYVTLDFEEFGKICFCLGDYPKGKFDITISDMLNADEKINDNCKNTEIYKTIDFMEWFGCTSYDSLYLGVHPHSFAVMFNDQIIEEYKEFSEKGIKADTANISLPMLDENGEWYSKCMFKFKNKSGQTAVIYFTATLDAKGPYKADMSTFEVYNNGLSDDDITDIKLMFKR